MNTTQNLGSRSPERSAFNPFSLDDWPRPFRTYRDMDPGETFVEYEGSSIFLPIRAVINGKEEMERVKLRAFMRAELWPAYMGGLGTREFQFTIRDWELFGRSRLLSKLYFNDERGRLLNSDQPELGRDQIVMTWTLAHHYVKFGDEENLAFAPTSHGLRIEGITDHNTDDGDIYWEIGRDSKDGISVAFFRAPPDVRAPDDLVARVHGLKPGAVFTAKSPMAEPPFTYKLPLRRETHGHGLIVSWNLGKNPTPGSQGKIHVVTPPRSICIADRPPIPNLGVDSSDFPAHIIYTANFQVWVNGTCIAPDEMGIAHAKGARAIPPRDVKVAFEKPVTGHSFAFSSGSCLGMHEISPDDFHQGVQLARAARARPV